MSSIFFFVFKVLVKSKTKISEERRIRRSEIDFFQPMKKKSKANKPFNAKSILLFLAEFWIIILLLFVFLCYQVIIQKNRLFRLKWDVLYTLYCAIEGIDQSEDRSILPLSKTANHSAVFSRSRDQLLQSKIWRKMLWKITRWRFDTKSSVKMAICSDTTPSFFHRVYCRYLVYSVTRFDYFLIQKWHFLTVNCTFPTADWDIYQQQ